MARSTAKPPSGAKPGNKATPVGSKVAGKAIGNAAKAAVSKGAEVQSGHGLSRQTPKTVKVFDDDVRLNIYAGGKMTISKRGERSYIKVPPGGKGE